MVGWVEGGWRQRWPFFYLFFWPVKLWSLFECFVPGKLLWLWGGELGWLCQGPTAPPGTGYLKTWTDRADSPTTAIEKWGARSGAGRFLVSSTHPGQSTNSVCSWTLSLGPLLKLKRSLWELYSAGKCSLNPSFSCDLSFILSGKYRLGC